MYYVCMVITYSKNKDQPGKVANPTRGQLNKKNEYFPVPVRAREFGLARRVRQSRPALPAHLHTYSVRLIRVLTYGIPPEFRGSVHLFIQTVIRHQVSLEFIGSHIAYRWRSLPRVRRHRANKPQGSPKQVLPWQVTMDQLICASLFHTHYWYELGMLKVPALSTTEDTRYICYYCVCFLCFLPIYSGHQVRWTYQPGSHRSKVTQDFSSAFLLRCVPSFFSREGFSHSSPSSTVKSNFVY